MQRAITSGRQPSQTRVWSFSGAATFIFGIAAGALALHFVSSFLSNNSWSLHPEKTHARYSNKWIFEQKFLLDCPNNETSKSLIEWQPTQNRYLVATCTLGQLSHRIICLKKTLIIAIILNRTLVIPNEDLHPFDYRLQLNIMFDFVHARSCLGAKSVLTVKEFLRNYMNDRRINIDRVACWFPKCYWFKHYKKWKSISLPPVFEDFSEKNDHNATAETILSIFGNISEPIITLGDLFHTKYFLDYNRLVPYELRNTKCRIVVKPHFSIFMAARAFVRQVLGSKFAALHLHRNHYFVDDYNVTRNPVWSTYDISRCLYKKLTRLNIEVLFVVTDTFDEEVVFLEKLLRGHSSGMGTEISVVRLPLMEYQKWANEVNRLRLANHPSAISAVNLMVATASTVFFSSHSSFSDEVREMRSSLKLPTCEDEFICQNMVWRDPVPDTFNDVIS